MPKYDVYNDNYLHASIKKISKVQNAYLKCVGDRVQRRAGTNGLTTSC